MTDFEQLRKWVEASKRIVFFGGAGTSTESGIPDFRSQNGLFTTQQGAAHPPERMLSRTFFDAFPDEFYRFYKQKMIYPQAQPNAGHLALARLESAGRLSALITQNIDGLHQLAGSGSVLELHGSVHRNRCMACGAFYSLEAMLAIDQLVPRCPACQGVIKPEVVLYEEPLDNEVFTRAADAVAEADMMIVAGTSLNVYPAAGLVRRYAGDKLVLINKSATKYDSYANCLMTDSFADVMGRLLQ
jgi:NAD-dependent deacetylase